MQLDVIVDDDAYLMEMHVQKGQEVWPLSPLCTVMFSGGVVVTLCSEAHGIVQPPANDEDFFSKEEAYVRKGTTIISIFPRMSAKEPGQMEGCTPRPTTVMAKRKARLALG